MKKKAKKRNRAAQDATLINLRALKKRVEKLENHSNRLSGLVNLLFHILPPLETLVAVREAVPPKRGRGKP